MFCEVLGLDINIEDTCWCCCPMNEDEDYDVAECSLRINKGGEN